MQVSSSTHVIFPILPSFLPPRFKPSCLRSILHTVLCIPHSSRSPPSQRQRYQEKATPQFALFRPLPGTSQASPDPTARVCLGAGPHQFWELAPVHGFPGPSSGCRAPWLSFPRQPDSFELNARSFADVAKPPSLPQGRRTARKPLEYLTRGVGVAVRRRQLSGSAMPKDSDDALTEPASRRLAGAVEPSRMHAVGQAIPGARRPGTAAALPCPSVPSC